MSNAETLINEIFINNITNNNHVVVGEKRNHDQECAGTSTISVPSMGTLLFSALKEETNQQLDIKSSRERKDNTIDFKVCFSFVKRLLHNAFFICSLFQT